MLRSQSGRLVECCSRDQHIDELRFDAVAVHDVVELHHSLRVEMFWDEMTDTG